MKILVVENEPHWQMVISGTLRSMDKEIGIRCVRTARHAHQILYADSGYDMVISDHFLDGGETGLQLWQDLRVEHREIPFIVVTGLKQEQLFESLGEDAGRPSYIAKPFHLEELKHLVGWKLGTNTRHARTANKLKKIILLMASAFALLVPNAVSKEWSVQSRSVPSTLHVNVDDIVTPALKARFEGILKRADAIVAEVRRL